MRFTRFRDVEETQLGSTAGGAGETAGMRKSDAGLPRGTPLGRYIVLEPIGAGGMGVVYAAYDPQLDRKVAIKLLHPSAESSTPTSQGRQRLLREAQSLARLQHPEVLTVLDVGMHAGRVFVAMEFVDGQTLRTWLRERARSWRDVLDVFVAAGRGLQAAHAKALIHRDFKPDNVMLDVDARTGEVERVRVMDFGLARARETSVDALPHAVDTGAAQTTADELTRTGAVMGTPAYMAPEQHRGQPADERSDQFGFCVALYEGLYGERPFAGASVPEIVASTCGGEIRPAPKGSAVPGWLRGVVVRGLAVDPQRRFLSMTELLAALRLDPTARRRRRWAAALLVGAIAGTWGVVQIRERERLAACERASHGIDEVWNDEARARVEAGLLGTGASYAPQTWALVQPRIDDEVEAWRRGRMESCGEDLDAALASVQDECFASSRAGLEDRIAMLADAGPAILNRAIALASAGRGIDACIDPVQLARRSQSHGDAAQREDLAELQRDLDRAGILETAGQYDEAERLAADVRRRAEAMGAARLAAQARARRGQVLNMMAKYPDAEREFEDAFFEATAARDPSTALWAATMLTAVVGANLARRDDGLRWARQARLLLELGEDHDDGMAGSLEYNVALVALKAGDYASAIPYFERALEIDIRRYGEHSTKTIGVLQSLGASLDGDHQLPRALEHLERALALSEEMYGLDHPAVADANNDLAAALLSADEPARAVAHLERAVEIHEAAGLEEKAAGSLDNLALAVFGLGKTADALAINARALAIRKRLLPADHPSLADTLLNRANLLDELGHANEAVSAIRAAIAIYEASLGPQHERVGDAYFNLANTQREMGASAEALASARRALAIRRLGMRVGHPKHDQAILMVADTALAVGQYALAIEELQPALARTGEPARPARVDAGMRIMLAHALLATGDPTQAGDVLAPAELDVLSASDRAHAQFLRARATWDAGGDRAAARRLAQAAAAELRAAAGEADPDLVAIDGWLARHPRP